MIAHISPASSAFEESRNTLTYAGRAKNIKTRVRALPGPGPKPPEGSLLPHAPLSGAGHCGTGLLPQTVSPCALPRTFNTCAPARKPMAPEGPFPLVQGHAPPALSPSSPIFHFRMPIQMWHFQSPQSIRPAAADSEFFQASPPLLFETRNGPAWLPSPRCHPRAKALESPLPAVGSLSHPECVEEWEWTLAR